MRTHAIAAIGAFLYSAICFAASNERSVEDIVVSTRPSVVVVTHYGRDGKQDGVGAGFIISKDGLIATCLHVIGEGRAIRVRLADDREFSVTEVHASDRKLDLAIVRIAATNLMPLKLGDSDALPQGAKVIAIGNPLGLEHSVVSGVVSAKREIQGNPMIQIAIPIEAGNSGGPLLDMRGRVQGLLTLKDAFSENLGFATPINELKKLMDRPNPVPIESWTHFASLDPAEWTPFMGAQWRRRAGAIHVEGAGSGFGGRSICLSHLAAPPAPYELSVSVKLDDESGAAGLIFGADDEQRHFGFYPTAGQMRLTRFDGPSVFSWTILKEVKTPQYRPGEWNTIKVRVETNRISGFVNGEKIIDSNESVFQRGRVGLAKFRQTVADFRDFRLSTGSTDRPPSPTLASAIMRAVQGQVITSADRTALRQDTATTRRLLMAEARRLDTAAADLRRLAGDLDADVTREKLVQALAQPDDKIDLFGAALLVARLDNPDLDISPYRAELAKMTNELRSQLPANASDSAKLDALSRFLFRQNGFHGSRTDYYNRANSYINDVIDDREGLPITLAILYLELARAIGVRDVSGIALPTHFMVKHAPKGGPERIIDVFDGGKVLTRSQAVEAVVDDAEAVSESDFKPAPKRAIIVRMLHNLLGLAQRSNSTADALRYLDTIIAINPESAPDRLVRARARVQAGNIAGAKADVGWLLEHDTPGLDSEKLAEWYRTL